MISEILMSCLSEAVVRSFLRMTLGFDHRVLDGAMGARFLAHLEGMLAQPQAWAR
jgi:pyruvate/2-oxoglutarate dehydrogenase complex dihydrolipoamide acyltransferase (E2) component